MIYTAIGKAVVKFIVSALRRRYSTQLRVGAGVAVVVAGIAAYLAARDVPEG